MHSIIDKVYSYIAFVCVYIIACACALCICDRICEKVPFHTFDIPANKMS